MRRFFAFKLIPIIFTLCLGVNFCFAQSNSGDQPYLPVMQNGKWGYIDQSGRVVIKPRFDKAGYFSDGWAKIQEGDKIAFINRNGDTVLKPELSDAGSFSEGLATASKPDGKKVGYINKKGKFVIPPRFVEAYAFSDGKAVVALKKRGPYGYIDKQGKFVIKPRFDAAFKFVRGLAPVHTGGFDGHWGYIDDSGKMVIKSQFALALPFSEGLAAVNMAKSFDDDHSWGYINRKGKVVIKPRFNYALSFSGGLAPVKYADVGWEYIDKRGKGVFLRIGNKRIKIAEPFRGKLARVSGEGYVNINPSGGKMIQSPARPDWAYIDKRGRKIWPHPQASAASKTSHVPNGFTVFTARWPSAYFSIVYPDGWSATDLKKRTGFIQGVSFVKNSRASKKLYKSGKKSMSIGKKIDLVTDDNIIINVSVQPHHLSDITPKKFIESMKSTVVNNPADKSIRAYSYQGHPFALRTIKGSDESGRKVSSLQLATKRRGRIVSLSAYMPAGSEKTTKTIINTMIKNMKVGVGNK